MSIEELKAENARLKSDVNELADGLKLASEVGIKMADEVTRLQSEVERLTLENSQYEEHHKYGQNVITSLREEVERLTKAGDAMAEDLLKEFGRKEMLKYQPYQNWNAAKEGEPSA
jgi:FtsZ-binding cell division protein ZapB